MSKESPSSPLKGIVGRLIELSKSVTVSEGVSSLLLEAAHEISRLQFEEKHSISLMASGIEVIERMKSDAARYRWLRKHYDSVNFEPAEHSGMDLIFGVPRGEVSADCDKTIDGLMTPNAAFSGCGTTKQQETP